MVRFKLLLSGMIFVRYVCNNGILKRVDTIASSVLQFFLSTFESFENL